ncbi:MAG TPA: leucyl aminopeptidase [Burkholderiales bacterium]|nr:leucyl aminopeptidase [Burkholderiales bacterium]
MEFSIKAVAPEKMKSDCVAVAVYASAKLSPAAQALDRASKGRISAVLKRGDFEAKPGSTLMLYDVDGIAGDRILLVGFGAAGTTAAKEFRDAVRGAVRAVADAGIEEAALYVSEVAVDGHDSAWTTMQAAMACLETTYRFDRLKSKARAPRKALKRIVLGLLRDSKTAAKALERGIAIGEGVNLARDLGNLPPNVCTPSYLAEQARSLGKVHKLKVTVLDRKEMEKLGMGSLLSVSDGSRQPPKLITLEYQGGPKKQKPVVLVGKGITFDTGGISLKPAAEMDEMKYDMSGAGSVLGTMSAVAAMRLPLNVVGVVPTTENMPGGNATRPGDIVTSMSGQTIEILNTDAEGRLILCDAMTYSERFEPAAVIDIATLTGACVIALGHVASGLFANDDRLADEVVAAGQKSWDRVWHMPAWDDYQDQLKSNFADMANIGGRPAGSVTAACFLARFAKNFKWAHLDIAGTAWKSGREKGSTGRPVPLLTQFLMTRAGW